MQIHGRTHFSVERAAVGLAVALLFLLQSIGVGFAAGATANNAQFSSALCASFKAQASKGDPSPIERQHVGPCCILHCSSAIDVEEDLVLLVILTLEMVSAAPTPVYEIVAAVVTPELRPLSPRAPPARLV